MNTTSTLFRSLLLSFILSSTYVAVAEAKAIYSAHKDPIFIMELHSFVAQMKENGCPPNREYEIMLIGAQYVSNPGGSGEDDVIGVCVTDFLGYRYISIDKNLQGMYKKAVIAHEALHCLWGIKDHNEQDPHSIMVSYLFPDEFKTEDQILKSAIKEANCQK